MGWGGRRRAGCGDPTHTCLRRAESKHCHFALRPRLPSDGRWQRLPAPTLLQPEPRRSRPRAGAGQTPSGCVGRARRSSLG